MSATKKQAKSKKKSAAAAKRPAKKKSVKAAAKTTRAVAPKKTAKKATRRAAPKAVKKTAAAKKPVAKKKAVATKKAAPKKAPARAKKVAPPRAPQRRDGTGHIDPQYAAELRERSLESNAKDDDAAFLPGHRSTEPLSEELGEEFVESATSGEGEGEDSLNREVTEELGGPFVVTSAGTEMADGTDESNPPGATKEPFPTS
jgi:hypothetical protein